MKGHIVHRESLKLIGEIVKLTTASIRLGDFDSN